MRDTTRHTGSMASTPVTVVTEHLDGRVDRRRAHLVHERDQVVPPGDHTSPCLHPCCTPSEPTA